MILPQALTNSISPETAVMVLLAVTGLALLIGVLLALHIRQQHHTIYALRRDLREANRNRRNPQPMQENHRLDRQWAPPPRPTPTTVMPQQETPTQRIGGAS